MYFILIAVKIVYLYKVAIKNYDMRSNLKPIIIHGLIERSQNKKSMTGKRFDFCEEMIIESNRKRKLRIEHEKELQIESEGKFVDVIHDGIRYKVLIKKDQNIQERQNRFIEKLKLRETK